MGFTRRCPLLPTSRCAPAAQGTQASERGSIKQAALSLLLVREEAKETRANWVYLWFVGQAWSLSAHRLSTFLVYGLLLLYFLRGSLCLFY